MHVSFCGFVFGKYLHLLSNENLFDFVGLFI